MVDHQELQGIPLLILANKKDLPNAKSSSEIATVLNVESMHSAHACLVHAMSALTT